MVIPENVAVRLMNSTEVTADNFFKMMQKRYEDEQQEYENAKAPKPAKNSTKFTALSQNISLPSLISSSSKLITPKSKLKKILFPTPSARPPTTISPSSSSTEVNPYRNTT